MTKSMADYKMNRGIRYRQGKGVAPDTIRDTLQDFFYRKTQSQPVVLPSLIRV